MNFINKINKKYLYIIIIIIIFKSQLTDVTVKWNQSFFIRKYYYTKVKLWLIHYQKLTVDGQQSVVGSQQLAISS